MREDKSKQMNVRVIARGRMLIKTSRSKYKSKKL